MTTDDKYIEGAARVIATDRHANGPDGPVQLCPEAKCWHWNVGHFHDKSKAIIDYLRTQGWTAPDDWEVVDLSLTLTTPDPNADLQLFFEDGTSERFGDRLIYVRRTPDDSQEGAATLVDWAEIALTNEREATK